jgi:hypothetical protein
VHAALGRTLVAPDDLPGADPVIVIPDRLWRTKLDANPNVLGTTLDLRAPYAYGGTYVRHHRIYTIVGVMRPDFKGIATVWVPSDYRVPLRQRASDLVAAQACASGWRGCCGPTKTRWANTSPAPTARSARRQPGFASSVSRRK